MAEAPLPKTMKQWTTALDGVDKLALGEAPVPEPGEGEVLVRIEAVSLNYRDVEGASSFLRLLGCVSLPFRCVSFAPLPLRRLFRVSLRVFCPCCVSLRLCPSCVSLASWISPP